MKIAPIDIAHKTFGRKIGGFDPEEVMDFLRAVSDEFEGVIRERNALKEALREKELAITEYKERDELLKSTITTATKMADKIQKDAEREAKLILQDADQKADMIQRDARDSLKKIYQDITDLKRLRLQFENNMKALIQSHLTMLDQGQKVLPNPPIEPKLNVEIEERVSRHDDLESRINESISNQV
ncbi:MAG: DivIVA domain-containing protein [Bdellovibrionales bacterium]|nr:DivIVA domain-containing protein [Bdellovibrionales bacterium]